MSPILPVIQPVTIDTMVNNNGQLLNIGLNFVTCQRSLISVQYSQTYFVRPPKIYEQKDYKWQAVSRWRDSRLNVEIHWSRLRQIKSSKFVVKVRLYCSESDIASRWFQTESNLMFRLSSERQRSKKKNSLLRSLSFSVTLSERSL